MAIYGRLKGPNYPSILKYALHVQKVEMLLETYSLHIYSTYSKLQLLKEYVEDTEVPTSASCN